MYLFGGGGDDSRSLKKQPAQVKESPHGKERRKQKTTLAPLLITYIHSPHSQTTWGLPDPPNTPSTTAVTPLHDYIPATAPYPPGGLGLPITPIHYTDFLNSDTHVAYGVT